MYRSLFITLNLEFKMSTYIIAEAGVNHNGDIELAKQLIEVAAMAGADAVKFQTYKTEALVGKHAPKAEYQKLSTDSSESQFAMLRKLELNESDYHHLVQHAKLQNIHFLSTPFDKGSLHFLTQQLGLEVIKVSSGELTNAPFLLEISRTAKKIILSTGMSSLAEIEAALGVIAFGSIFAKHAIPTMESLASAFASEEGQKSLYNRVTLLHCTSDYPAPFDEVNLRAMKTMSVAFGLPVGYSDHTSGIHISLAAVALGAQLIEKHFTLDRNLSGPDHKASIEPHELAQMVRNIREIELALGDGIKRPTASEWNTRTVARRHIVAQRAIAAGEIYTEESLTCKRPGIGRSPFEYWNLLGQASKEDYSPDEPLL